MLRRQIRRTGITMATGVMLVALAVPGAQAAPEPLMDPARATALAAELGDDRMAGVYYENGRLVVAVTDETAARSVREAGGAAKVVAHSADELNSAQADLDRLAGIPNTAWGVDPSGNQVVVSIYDGVSAADRARIEKVAATHGDAVSVENKPGTLQSTVEVMRGGLGITSGSRTCSAAFNVRNGSWKTYMLTAGHCMVGGYYDWDRRSNGVYLGRQTTFSYGGDGDYAIVEYLNSNVIPYGTIQYRDASTGQITTSRYAYDGEKVKRVGTMSQDLDGMVLQPSTTVTYSDGITLKGMIKTSLCNKLGDSGGALFTGTTALGITSGGNYVDQPCGDTDAQSDRETYYHPVQKVLSAYGLQVI
ncbi:S1 family peptidase [Streptomyces sp. NPDC085460]|uniref:S1 family peptidase n=1 Tax=Streptomyces sp. NPDC085460 TaxID=3365723 RepID=UPI0037D22F1C